MNEMSHGTSTVGSILGAMVYQIGEMKEKRHNEAIKQINAKSNSERSKKGRTMMSKK